MKRILELAPGLYAHASGALWLPDQKSVLVADPHLGQPVTGRLDDLLRELNPKTVVFLGDLVDSGSPREEVESALVYLAGQAQIVLAGSPGVEAEFPSPKWQIVAGWRQSGPPEIWCGEPTAPAGVLAVSGHLHPCVRFQDAARASKPVPVFLKGPSGLILPAFCPLTSYDINSKIPAKWCRFLGTEEIQCVAATGSQIVDLGRMVVSCYEG